MSKEKQIIEIKECIDAVYGADCAYYDVDGFAIANEIYNAGYRKQSEGEWTRVEVNGKNYGQVYYQHKECRVNETQLFTNPHHFCPNCGAKMKGGAE